MRRLIQNVRGLINPSVHDPFPRRRCNISSSAALDINLASTPTLRRTLISGGHGGKSTERRAGPRAAHRV
jgi:hypothetical protein